MNAIPTALHPPKVWEQFVDDPYSIRTHQENVFHHINNLHQDIKYMEEESNGGITFLDTS